MKMTTSGRPLFLMKRSQPSPQQNIGANTNLPPNISVVRSAAHAPLPRDAYTSIPKTIFVAYHKANPIPQKVLDRLEQLNPGFKIDRYEDERCLEYVRKYWSSDHVAFFQSLSHKPTRIEFWLACIMYTHGGYYLHQNAVPYVSFSSFVLPNTDVCTSGSYRTGLKDSKGGIMRQLDPLFIAARPRTHIMSKAVGHMMVSARLGYSYSGMSLTFSLLRSIDIEMNTKIPSNTGGVYRTKAEERVQLLTEQAGRSCKTRIEHLESLVIMWGDKKIIKHTDSALLNR